MSRIDLYIGRSVLSGTLLAWAVVVSLDAVFALLGEVGDIGRGSYALDDALLYIALTLPARAYQSFPMAVLIGTLLGLGNLAVQGELDALRLAGCSPLRLARAVLQAGLVAMLFAVLLGEGWAPGLRQLATELRTSEIFGDASVQTGSGFWVRDGGRLIRVGVAAADGHLGDLVIYELDTKPQLLSVTAVAAARFDEGGWQLQGVRSSHFGEDRVETRQQPESEWQTLLDPRLARLLSRDALSLSLNELGAYIDYIERNGSPVASYRLNYWQRLMFPLAALAMLLLALGLLLGRLGRRGAGSRLLAGVAAGLLFKLLNELMAHAGMVYGMPPWLSAGLPSLLVVFVGLLLLVPRNLSGAGAGFHPVARCASRKNGRAR